jgi:hypothetical protein
VSLLRLGSASEPQQTWWLGSRLCGECASDRIRQTWLPETSSHAKGQLSFCIKSHGFLPDSFPGRIPVKQAEFEEAGKRAEFSERPKKTPCCDAGSGWGSAGFPAPDAFATSGFDEASSQNYEPRDANASRSGQAAEQFCSPAGSEPASALASSSVAQQFCSDGLKLAPKIGHRPKILPVLTRVFVRAMSNFGQQLNQHRPRNPATNVAAVMRDQDGGVRQMPH